MAMIIKMCFIITITRLIDLLFVHLQSLQNLLLAGISWVFLYSLIVIVLISIESWPFTHTSTSNTNKSFNSGLT